MYIRMDNREPVKIRETLKNKHQMDVKWETLTAGDYLFSDICIERKTTGDLLKSLRDGRVWTQLKTDKENYPRVFLLLEGGLPYGYNRQSAVDEMKAIGGLLGVTMGWGVPVIPTQNAEQTARVISQMFHRSNQAKTEYLRPVKKKHYTVEEVIEDVLCTIPGVGRKTARELLTDYPTIKLIQSATDEELKSYPRIGNKTIEWIRNVLG